MAEGTTSVADGGKRKRRRSTFAGIFHPKTSSLKAKKHNGKSFIGSKNVSADDDRPDPVHGECLGSICDSLNGLLLTGAPYRLGLVIGTGFFGQVRIARHTRTNEEVAVKLERAETTNHSILKNEWKMYGILHATPAEGVPKLLDFGQCGEKYALVLELMGPSLRQAFIICKRKFSLHTILMIGIQLITRLEYVHSKQIVHRDVKPDNILITKPPSQNTTIFITDFGLSTYYADPSTREHIAYLEEQEPLGTGRYMSLNTHKGIIQSRRDDLESLGYTLFYFSRGSLPWDGIKDKTAYETSKQIFNIKKATPLEILCEGLAIELLHYMDYVRNLKYREKPNYKFLRDLFIRRLKREGLDPNGCMDWTDKIGDARRMSAI